ncbi:MAG: carboxylesterase/lipase family protein [Pseudomonadales bacterium]|jgi:para-nitrobenzyl esterase
MSLVTTDKGLVQGVESDGLLVFKGIPYAAPPIGKNRWLPPQPHPDWQDTLNATKFGPEAPQNPSSLDALMGTPATPPVRDEDCLYLNIWTTGTDGSNRPVMFWIHGGGFTIGSGSGGLYDGSFLAQEGDVVVVTINYRMGALGFMNLNDATNGKIPATGNEGLLDQIAALSWVQENIEAFGGDKNNVTIFGESAGGMSIGALLAIPAAKGLFHKAIPQSGACNTAMTKETGISVTNAVLELLGTSDADELMAMSTEQLTEVQTSLAPIAAERGLPGMSFQPVIDGSILSDLPIELVKAGSAEGVAILTGYCAEEWKLFSALDPAQASITDEQLITKLEKTFPDNAEQVVTTYRDWLDSNGKASSPADISAAISTDGVFRLPALVLLEAQKKFDDRTYCYLFDWTSPLMEGVLGACHAIELGFNWGTYDKNGAENFFGQGPEADKLSDLMRTAWLNFARTGNPAGGSVGEWPAYKTDSRATMLLSTEPGIVEAPNETTRQIWQGPAMKTIGTL